MNFIADTNTNAILKLMSALPERPGARIVAIDGRAASGKTTLAARLEEMTGAGVVHMDDFFLPEELRTTERLAAPGGNVHYERFLAEVADNLSIVKAFSYQRFDCSKMRLTDKRNVRESELRIVEGSYSCHPKLGRYMDVRVFCDIDPAEQLKRIQSRDGFEMAENFKTRWIPMEELYFAAFSVADHADFIYTGKFL